MKTLPSFKFFGHLTDYDGNGKVELFIDYDRDFEGRILRNSFVVDLEAFKEYLIQHEPVRPCEFDDCIQALMSDVTGAYTDVIGNYLLLSKSEWIPLDENNEPIPVAVEAPMFNYFNQ